MATELAKQPALDEYQHKQMDTILRPHLRLEPFPEETKKRHAAHRLEDTGVTFKTPVQHQQEQKTRTTVLQSTIEMDNKRRPGILKRNSSRYQPPNPEPPDPNSEAKSAVIQHMQNNLEDWDKQMQIIVAKKNKNDQLQRSEIEKRDNQIKDLTEKLHHESEVRAQTEEVRDSLKQQLTTTEEELDLHRAQMQELQTELIQYQSAYDQAEGQRQLLEEQNDELIDKLEQTEAMKKRLNDTITELQGQLAIVEQRSQFCSVM